MSETTGIYWPRYFIEWARNTDGAGMVRLSGQNLLDAAEAMVDYERDLREARAECERLQGVERAAIEGAMAAAEGKPLHAVAESGYRPRTAKGDAWERGWQFAANTYNRSMSDDTSKGCPEIEQLRAAIEPGTASAIAAGVSREAERLGFSPYSSKPALTWLVEEIERLRAALEKIAYEPEPFYAVDIIDFAARALNNESEGNDGV